MAIGAGLAVGLGAIATGFAQARIGAAAMGADRREARADRSRDPAGGDPRDARHPRLRRRRDDDRAALTMALADLLRAIEAEAAAERARADAETAAEAAAIVERRAAEASALEAELAATPEARGARGGRAGARPRPARCLRRRCGRRARRRSRSLLAGIRAELAALRGHERATRSCSARCSPRAWPRCPRRAVLRVDPRDADLASCSPAASRVDADARDAGAASSWRATTAGRSGTRSRSGSPTPSRCCAAGSRSGSRQPRRTRGVR